MILGGQVTVQEIDGGPSGTRVTAAALAKMFEAMIQSGYRPVWPPVHCPSEGRDRFMLAGLAAAPKRAGPPGPGGGGGGGWENLY